ncbi:hypothetical protein IGI04_024730 [Brassica rapa subsp. trilocularis]|uniref:Uncharacterized protein n=1 Tax=Brassica rapa subsp. trilocularis TaxID=1813537 RepID=A0ABQ7M865_BRACM|nr:hypothetical protein IGI04_024730 [Brassica rapa subsp. trilocularis]
MSGIMGNSYTEEWSAILAFMSQLKLSRSLFALHKSLSGFGVSIGDLRGTWKHLGSKREWEMLFRRAKHQSGVRERRATPAPEESKVGATSSTEVIHPLQTQLLVDDFHDAKRPMGATSRTRAGCRATSGATSSTRARFGEVKHVLQSDLWERPSAPAPRFGVSIGDLRGTWKHLGSKREWEMLFRRAKHQSGVRERRATPAPEESKVGATSSTEVIHPLQAQLLVDDFHDAKRPMGATSRTRAGCRATSGATSSTRARFGEVKHVLQSDLWERPSAPAPRFILCRKLMFYLGF